MLLSTTLSLLGINVNLTHPAFAVTRLISLFERLSSLLGDLGASLIGELRFTSPAYDPGLADRLPLVL
jgi:hypothetical protein